MNPVLAERLEDRRLLAAVASLDFDFNTFTGPVAGMTLRGDAAVTGNVLRVSAAQRYGQGSVFTNDRLILGPDTGFESRFSFVMGGGNGTRGGDGLVFVLYGGTAEPALPQWPGGTIGYAGLFPSLAVEFDSAQDATDPVGDHVAIHRDGNSSRPINPSAVAVLGGDLNDGRVRHAWVEYSGPSDNLRVFLSDSPNKPAVPVLSQTLDLASVAGGQVRVGLTAASGWNFNSHDVTSWSFRTVPASSQNRPPVANPDAVTVSQNSGPNPVDVLANDSDPDGDTLRVLRVGNASHGTVTTDGTRAFYRPNLGYAGADAFTYTVGDGRGGEATATVSVTVRQAVASGVFQLESGSYIVGEGDGFVEIGVLRVGGSTGVATLDFLTVPGTATAGVDYVSRSGTLRFEPGQTRQTIRIDIVDDADVEGPEWFGLSLDAVTGADLGAPRTTQITIIDNDFPTDSRSGDVPWREAFNYPDGTNFGNAATGWSIDLDGAPAASFGVWGNRLRLTQTNTVATWRSEPISLGGAASATLSLNLRGIGDMETTGTAPDFLEILYVPDGRTPVLLHRQNGNTNGLLELSLGGITGQRVELLIRGRTNAGDEIYYVDDIVLAASNAPTIGSTRFYAQAEAAERAGVGQWTLRDGGSGGRHVQWTGTSQNNAPTASLALQYAFTTDFAGWHDVHLHARTSGTGDNSFWVRIPTHDRIRSTGVTRTDGFVNTNGMIASADFIWHDVRNDNASGRPVARFWLNEGTHTLEVAPRERNARLDGVYVTNTPDAPSRTLLDAVAPPVQPPPPPPPPQPPVEPVGTFQVRTVTSNVQNVTDVVVVPGLSTATGDTVFVAERAGRIRTLVNGTLNATPFVAFEDEVNGTRDRGLLGITVHPNFPTVPYVYALFTYDPPEAANGTGLAARDANGNRAGRLVRFTADPAHGHLRAVPGSAVVILGKNSTWANISSPDRDSTGTNNFNIPASGTPEHRGYINDFIATDSQSHSVGDLAFGPDGMLYVTLGDATSYGATDPRSRWVQDINTLRGKVLRVDPATGRGLPDNPFYTGDADDNASRVWALGLRNPFSVAVSPRDGSLFIGDVGWSTVEEINRVPTGPTATGQGLNFGWPWYEGRYTGNAQANGYRNLPEAQRVYSGQTTLDGVLTTPVFSRDHSQGARAFIVGDFLTGSAWPTALRDSLLLVDWQSGRIEAVVLDGNGAFVRTQTLVTGVGQITSMTAADGRIYYGDWQGRVGVLEYR